MAYLYLRRDYNMNSKLIERNFKTFILYTVLFIIYPLIDYYTINSYEGLGVIMLLLAINPSVILATSTLSTYKYGINIYRIIIMVLVYTVSVFIIYNSSALGYVIFYILIDLVGVAIGYFFRKRSDTYEKRKIIN